MADLDSVSEKVHGALSEITAARSSRRSATMTTDDDKPGCKLCPDDVPRSLAAMLDHLRVLHPDVYGDGPERWPDGMLVIEDTTLKPGDFGGEL